MKAYVNIEYTLNNGQAFRWKKVDDEWRGVCRDKIIHIHQEGDEISFRGASQEFISSYLRLDDDLDEIYESICTDQQVAAAVERFKGMRLLRQDLWECSASYMLATNATVPRIKSMIENVCKKCGRELEEGIFAFPLPEQIVEQDLSQCGLGFRAERLKKYAESVLSGEFNLSALYEMNYDEAIASLMTVYGIGPKVADCIALFSLGHLKACPIDARISHVMEDIYGIKGSYAKVGAYARDHFGPYAGYAQEYFYIGMSAEYKDQSSARQQSGHTHAGAFKPV